MFYFTRAALVDNGLFQQTCMPRKLLLILLASAMRVEAHMRRIKPRGSDLRPTASEVQCRYIEGVNRKAHRRHWPREIL